MSNNQNVLQQQPVSHNDGTVGGGRFTNFTDVVLSDAEKSLLEKGPKFSVAHTSKPKVLLEMKTGFQKLAHDLRWHCNAQLNSAPVHMQSSDSNLGTDNRVFPLISDRKEINLPQLIPEVEAIINSCHNKYLSALKFVETHRLPSNLNHFERNALESFRNKGLLAVPCDKGGDLCVINKSDYDFAVAKHLDESPIYRRVSRFDVAKLDSKINDVWFKICKENKVPRKIQNMYASTCSKFASIHAVIKTHKSSIGNIVIRPIVNSIGSPGYNLSRFVQQIIQSIVVLKSSDQIINDIKTLDKDLLAARNYPFSLDVENMFHNIPRDQSINLLHQKLVDSNFVSPIPHGDLIKLVSVCLNSNHFVYGNSIFYQKDGLPMGNRLSGILAELFIGKVVDELTSSPFSRQILFRYVDDLLVFGIDESDAKTTLNTFNSNSYGIKFTLELPVDGALPYLDFKVSVSPSGDPYFSFFRKPMRKEVSINATSAFPKNSMKNVIRNEILRIDNRCTDPTIAQLHKKKFLSTLKMNGHNPRAITAFLRQPVRRFEQLNNSEKFFLSIPFVSEKTDRLVRNALSQLGVPIIIAHKGSNLKDHLSNTTSDEKCLLRNCGLKNQLCMRKGVVYQLQCDLCKKDYIGSSWRHLHTRVKEHHTHRSSAVYTHNLSCSGRMCVRILANDINTQRLRIKEALLIKRRRPTLNTKDDLLGSHILFDD
jgi:hypothetical protein